MTVSRAINNPEQLSEKTRKAVQDAIEQLNYVPNIAAQKIRGVSENTIGVLSFSTATTPFSVEILLAIEKTVRQYGWNSFVINTFEDDEQDVEKAVELLLSHRPTAIIITRHGLKKLRSRSVWHHYRLYWQTV
ncbi:LacI family transcriptional regulator [Actinobacillus equuli subsp. haemolyticus]|nr:LacI family DNA-binding transcriptional regulator [Actinobacillus equuli]WGE64251.1 LacI family transcriptional regulator [Actinobacillus equuli subsp. haemolyticus]